MILICLLLAFTSLDTDMTLLFLLIYFMCVCVPNGIYIYNMCGQGLLMSEGGNGSSGSGLQAIVNHHETTENSTKDLQGQLVLLTAETSL